MSCLLIVVGACTAKHEITITNDADFDRVEEITELDTAFIGEYGLSNGFKILCSDNEEIPYQLTYDGKIIFPVSVAAKSEARYIIVSGTPAPCDTVVYGRFVPERMDDMAWENDRSAYRAYGPALEKSGERAFGYDIWTKSVSHPVINQRYHDHIDNGISFHVDHGEGMDVYAVGPTLGGGTAALINDDGEIVYPYCYRDYEILDNGPLRFTVKLIYGDKIVDADSTVIETRVISLDRGSYLNKTTVSYSGLSADKVVAPGIVVHAAAPDGYVLVPEDAFIAYADLTDNANAGNGTIFVGVVSPGSTGFEYMPLKEPVGDAVGHIIAPAVYSDSSDFTYWWGSGWSKGGMPDLEAWIDYLREFGQKLGTPLKVEVR